MKKYEYAILSIILLSAFFINSFYNTNSFPIHPDEYTHIAQGVDIIEKGKIDFVNPYFSYPLFHPRLESGFHLLLAILIIIFKDNFIFWFNFLKNLIFVLNTFLIFFLAYRISKNFLIGIFSATFFLFLKSDIFISAYCRKHNTAICSTESTVARTSAKSGRRLSLIKIKNA